MHHEPLAASQLTVASSKVSEASLPFGTWYLIRQVLTASRVTNAEGAIQNYLHVLMPDVMVAY